MQSYQLESLSIIIRQFTVPVVSVPGQAPPAEEPMTISDAEHDSEIFFKKLEELSHRVLGADYRGLNDREPETVTRITGHCNPPGL